MKTMIQFSVGFINGILTSICYIKRPDKHYHMYKLTWSSARRIKALKNIILDLPQGETK